MVSQARNQGVALASRFRSSTSKVSTNLLKSSIVATSRVQLHEIDLRPYLRTVTFQVVEVFGGVVDLNLAMVTGSGHTASPPRRLSSRSQRFCAANSWSKVISRAPGTSS